MTVSTLDFYRVYVAAAGQTVIPYPFRILAAADLRMYIDGVLKVLGVDYTVSGAGNVAGGNATMVAALAGGETIIVRRQTPKTQATDLAAGQQFYEDAIEAMADRLMLIAQESPATEIPLAPAGYYLRIKADGSGIEAVAAISTIALNVDFGTGPPVDGTWATGHIRFNILPVAGENIGWVCLNGGTPGTWYAFGFISANPA